MAAFRTTTIILAIIITTTVAIITIPTEVTATTVNQATITADIIIDDD